MTSCTVGLSLAEVLTKDNLYSDLINLFQLLVASSGSPSNTYCVPTYVARSCIPLSSKKPSQIGYHVRHTILVQVSPSPVNPLSQEQVSMPAVLVQVALSWHKFFPFSHSLISAEQNNNEV